MSEDPSDQNPRIIAIAAIAILFVIFAPYIFK